MKAPGRPPTIGVVRKRSLALDEELEAAVLEEHAIRRVKYRDVDYTETSTIRQLIREAVEAARAARQRNTQQTLPLELTTTKS